MPADLFEALEISGTARVNILLAGGRALPPRATPAIENRFLAAVGRAQNEFSQDPRDDAMIRFRRDRLGHPVHAVD